MIDGKSHPKGNAYEEKINTYWSADSKFATFYLGKDIKILDFENAIFISFNLGEFLGWSLDSHQILFKNNELY